MRDGEAPQDASPSRSPIAPSLTSYRRRERAVGNHMVGYGTRNTSPVITPASSSAPRTLSGTGGSNQGAQLPGR